MARQITLFSGILPRFSALWVDDDFKSDIFIAVHEDLINVAEKFGNLFQSILFGMKENLTIIHSKFATDPEQFKFGRNLIKSDANIQDAAMRLSRQTNFFQTVFDMFAENDGVVETLEIGFKENLKDIIKVAYSLNLGDYHGWLGSQLINVLVKYVPSKKEFYRILACKEKENVDGFCEALVRHDLRKYSAQLKKITEFEL